MYYSEISRLNRKRRIKRNYVPILGGVLFVSIMILTAILIVLAFYTGNTIKSIDKIDSLIYNPEIHQKYNVVDNVPYCQYCAKEDIDYICPVCATDDSPIET